MQMIVKTIFRYKIDIKIAVNNCIDQEVVINKTKEREKTENNIEVYA